MKNAFAIVTFAGLLSACTAPLHQVGPVVAAAVPVPAPVPTPAATPVPAAMPVSMSTSAPVAASTPVEIDADAAAETAAAAAASATEARLPKVALTGELLYKLMKAELEFRSGNWQPAYLAMMAAAQRTRDPRLAQRATEMALLSKQGEPALAAIRRWRQLAPDSAEASQYYLGFVILSDNLAEAEPILRAHLRAAAPAERGLAIFHAQQLLARARDKAAAGAMTERLMAPYAGTMEAHIVLAQAAFARGAGAVAVKEARAALALKPDAEIAALTLAQVTDDEAGSAAVLSSFVAANPGARDVRAAYARVLVSRRQYEPARQQFLALQQAEPDNLGTLYALGVVSLQLHDQAGAERYFIRFADLLAANPDPERDASKVFVILAQLAEERGDRESALQWLDKVEQGEGAGWFNAQLKRAQLVGRGGDIDAARKLLAGLPAAQPAEQVQVRLAEAQILRDSGRLDEAYALMQTAVAAFPDNADLLYDFALLAEKTGRLDVMEQSLRSVIRQVPGSHHAYNALGYSLAERNVRLQEALALIDKALALAPGDPFIMDSMGWVQFRLGNLSAAESQLRQAYTLRSDPEIAVHLGEVLWQKGQKADAQKLWREARAKDPKNDTLKNTLARLNASL